MFGDGSDWDLAVYSGFPLSAPLFVLDGTRVPIARGFAAVRIGQFSLPSAPEGTGGDAFQLDGASVAWEHQTSRVLGYAGRTTYSTLLDGVPRSALDIGGAEYHRQGQRSVYGGAVVALRNAFTIEGQPSHGFSRADFEHDLSATSRLFGSAYISDRAAPAFRIGTRLRSFRGDLIASVYTFGKHMPLVYPLLRPGETGLQLSGSYRPAEFSRLYGDLIYASDKNVLRRTDLRGHVGYSYWFGTVGPYIDVAYHHDELTHEQLTRERENVLADRFVASISRASILEWMAVRFDHVIRRSQPDRTQLLGSWGRLIGPSSSAEASLLLQNEQHFGHGATTDASYERLVRWPYSMIVGGGLAYVDRSGNRTADGLARIGFSRRFNARISGWYARVEARLTFGVGLPRSELAANAITFSVGNRIGWSDLEHARSLVAAMASPSSFAAIDGVVTLDGKGLANVPVLLDGERRTTTGQSGRYRLSRIPVGVVNVSIDPNALEQGYVVLGSPSKAVLLTGGSLGRADFAIAHVVSFAGAVVMCRGAETAPQEGVRLALLGHDVVRTSLTSSLGAFEFDQVPPGQYDLVIDPATVPQIAPENLQRRSVDLVADVLGYVVKLGCSGEGAAPVMAPAASGTVQGAVRLNGLPIADASVLVDGILAARTKGDGTFTLTHGVGDHLISVESPAMETPGSETVQRVVVRESETAVVLFDIRRLLSFEGALVCEGKRERSLAGVKISLLGERVVEATTSPTGLFMFAAVAPGRYLIIIDPVTLDHSGVSASEIPRLMVNIDHNVSAYRIAIGCRSKAR